MFQICQTSLYREQKAATKTVTAYAKPLSKQINHTNDATIKNELLMSLRIGESWHMMIMIMNI